MFIVNHRLILFSITLMILTSCTRLSPKCQIDDLLLSESLFPSGTDVEPIVSPIPELPKESFAQGFYYPPDAVSYMVTRWFSISDAKSDFESILKVAFVVDEYRGPWETPKELSYSSIVADKYHVACGIVDGIYQCRMGAAYDEYSVYLRAGVSEQGINFLTINQLLRAIDEKMAQCTK